MRKILLSLSLVLWVTFSFAQTKPLTELTVEEIMQSQSEFVGTPTLSSKLVEGQQKHFLQLEPSRFWRCDWL